MATTAQTLRRENRVYRHTGGISENNRDRGFLSAFCDHSTGRVYRSCFADGRPAPIHLLDGLPDEVVLARDTKGRVVAVKSTVVAGFVCADCFYTREQAACLTANA
jgi:hypothetical protein